MFFILRWRLVSLKLSFNNSSEHKCDCHFRFLIYGCHQRSDEGSSSRQKGQGEQCQFIPSFPSKTRTPQVLLSSSTESLALEQLAAKPKQSCWQTLRWMLYFFFWIIAIGYLVALLNRQGTLSSLNYIWTLFLGDIVSPGKSLLLFTWVVKVIVWCLW